MRCLERAGLRQCLRIAVLRLLGRLRLLVRCDDASMGSAQTLQGIIKVLRSRAENAAFEQAQAVGSPYRIQPTRRRRAKVRTDGVLQSQGAQRKAESQLKHHHRSHVTSCLK